MCVECINDAILVVQSGAFIMSQVPVDKRFWHLIKNIPNICCKCSANLKSLFTTSLCSVESKPKDKR